MTFELSIVVLVAAVFGVVTSTNLPSGFLIGVIPVVKTSFGYEFLIYAKFYEVFLAEFYEVFVSVFLGAFGEGFYPTNTLSRLEGV